MVSVEEAGKAGFSIKSALIAVVLSTALVASSSYVALKIGALPWPIILSVVLSAGLMRLFSRRVSPHEINVAQAGGSIGGLMASALVFTVPAIWFLQKQDPLLAAPSIITLIIISVLGGVLGVLLSLPLRRAFIDAENLPYPSGRAGGELIKAGFEKGNFTRIVVIVGLITIAFVALRELFFPAGLSAGNSAILAALAAAGVIVSLYPMPMAVGVGYLIGKRSSYSWFFGSITGWLVFVPYLYSKGLEASEGSLIAQNLGMGIVLGSGIGFLLIFIVPRFKKIFGPVFRKGERWYFRMTPVFSILTIIVLALVGVPLLASLIAVIGVWVMVAVAARMTGETDIDPLEQFGILIGLAAVLLYSVLSLNLGILPVVLIIVFVSVATAIAGDIGHDYKSASVLGTKVSDIVRVDLLAVIAAAIVGPLVLVVIKEAFSVELFTAAMPAPQAQLVAGSVSGFAYPQFFLAGLTFAVVFEVINRFVRAKYKQDMPLALMPFGIGMFLGLTLGILFFFGGLIRDFMDRKRPGSSRKGILVSAALMGGEGIAGFGAAVLFVSGMFSKISSNMALLVLSALALAVYFLVKSVRGKNK